MNHWKKKLIPFVAITLTILFLTATAMAGREHISGIVVVSDRGVTIETAHGIYWVKGADLAAVAGQPVSLTGEVTETDRGRVITVEADAKPTPPPLSAPTNLRVVEEK
jgi:hypothetical protein